MQMKEKEMVKMQPIWAKRKENHTEDAGTESVYDFFFSHVLFSNKLNSIAKVFLCSTQSFKITQTI